MKLNFEDPLWGEVHNIAQKNFQTEVEKELRKLSVEQLKKFYCIYYFRCLPFMNLTLENILERKTTISLFLATLILTYAGLTSKSYNSKYRIKAKHLAEFMIKNNSHINIPLYRISECAPTYFFLSEAVGEKYYFVTNNKEIGEQNMFSYFCYCDKQFRKIIFEDIKNIKNNNNSLDIYDYSLSEKWYEFHCFLKNIDCEFFAETIETLFLNGFKINDDDKYIECILNIPTEMYIDKNNNISSYLYNMLKGSKRLNEARLILLGDKGSGKTSLARRLLDPYAKMPKIEESTPGVDISSFRVCDISKSINSENNTNVRLWDFAGHTITHAAHRCFLSERCVYVILCESRKENTDSLNYWLELVRNYGGNSKVFVLINRQDQNIVKVDENRITRDFSENECEFFYFSIKDDNETDLIHFRNRIANYIANSPSWSSNQIGVDWFKIKESLENRFGNSGESYISIDIYNDIADSIGVKDREEALKALSALGVCLYYPQIEDLRTVVLDPEWITFGIYYIINWLANKSNGYKISINDFQEVFENHADKYPLDKHRFLYRLMIKYELAYEETEDILVIPQCMQTDEPHQLPKFDCDYLQIRFEAKNVDGCQIHIPPDLMPRIIVKRSLEMKNHRSFAWRYGAVLYSEKAIALIIQNGSVLNIKVSGERASEFLYKLYITVQSVIDNYDSFQKNKPIFSVLPFCTDGERGEITPVQTLNNVIKQGNIEKINPLDNSMLDVDKTVENYHNIIININSNFSGTLVVEKKTIVNQYSNCNFELQGSVNEIISKIPVCAENEELIEDLKELSEAMEMNENKLNSTADYKKTGLWAKLKRFRDKYLNSDSTLYKVLSKTKKGITLLCELITGYNKFASLTGLPSIDSFL